MPNEIELLIVTFLTFIIGMFAGNYISNKEYKKLIIPTLLFVIVYGLHLIYVFY